MRVGLKVPATTIEKSYVLFLEELLAPSDNETQPDERSNGTMIGIATRFGVPIYLKPLKETPAATIGEFSVSKAKVSLLVKNTGNVSLTIPDIEFSAGDYFSNHIPGGVILAGAARHFDMPIPQAVCNSLGKLDVKIKTRYPRLQLIASTTVNNAQCQ